MAFAASAHGDDPLWRRLGFAPALAIMVLFTLLPMLNLAAMSFFKISWQDAKAIWEPVGTANYAALGSDKLFHASMRNTAVFAIASVLIQVVLGFAMALFVSRISRGRTLYRMIFILPLLIPGIVIGAIWKLMLNADFGLINQILALFGIWPVDWLGEESIALFSVVMVDVWHWTPFCFLLLLAGIESLPQDIYEQAKIDGANAWQEFRQITLPLMVPALIVTFIFRFIVAFKVFDEVYLLTAGGPGTATEVLSFTIYQRFFTENRIGYGAAMSIAVIFLICLMLVIAAGVRRRAGSAA